MLLFLRHFELGLLFFSVWCSPALATSPSVLAAFEAGVSGGGEGGDEDEEDRRDQDEERERAKMQLSSSVVIGEETEAQKLLKMLALIRDKGCEFYIGLSLCRSCGHVKYERGRTPGTSGSHATGHRSFCTRVDRDSGRASRLRRPILYPLMPVQIPTYAYGCPIPTSSAVASLPQGEEALLPELPPVSSAPQAPILPAAADDFSQTDPQITLPLSTNDPAMTALGLGLGELSQDGGLFGRL